MRRPRAVLAAVFTLVFATCTLGQLVVVHDPTKEAQETKMTAAEQAVFDSQALPAAKRAVSKDVCEPDVNVARVARGAFSRQRSSQLLVFYQLCQTGNGYGYAGLVLIDGGKVVGNFMANAGWTVDVGRVPDVNKNGLDEFKLLYSGGLHQGQGGVGVDLMEFVDDLPKAIGWYQAEKFDETEASTVWKLTAKPGPTPVFYKQKYFSGENSTYKRVGANTLFKLSKAISKFERVK